MKLSALKLTLIICTVFIYTSASMAGFDITRMTTVVDDLSGSYTVTKSGRISDSQFTGHSLTEFNQFHPGTGENEAVISGTVSKQISRANGQINTTSEGAFMVESIDGSWQVSFKGLVVQVDDAGVELLGSVVVNEETYDAADLPASLSLLLRRVFWMTRR